MLTASRSVILTLAYGAILGVFACSGADLPPDSLGTGDGGTPSSSGSTNGANGGGGDPLAACISACETKYPNGTQLGGGIDACWSKSCATECIGIGTGQIRPPGRGSCTNPVSTPSAACSQCTVDHCCTPWDACFGDDQCSALNKCSIACYK
jgi:hypothetical protein